MTNKLDSKIKIRLIQEIVTEAGNLNDIASGLLELVDEIVNDNIEIVKISCGAKTLRNIKTNDQIIVSDSPNDVYYNTYELEKLVKENTNNG